MSSLQDSLLRRSRILIVGVLCLALGFSLALNLRHSDSALVAAPQAPQLGDWRDGFAEIADRLSPSVVNITSEKMVRSQGGMTLPPGLEDFFDFGPFRDRTPNQAPREQLTKATGSGVIVRSDGYIMTNNHVVAGADRVTVKLNDGREFTGTVLQDPRTDLALVKIDATGLPAAQFADSDELRVGQWAIAIGNPFGLRNTMTVGIISALRREADPDVPIGYPEVIQTDASINPGNSGGPLVDDQGQVIGINFMIYSRTGGNQGIGFAIPANSARFVMEQLIERGKVVRGYLGLMPQDLTPVLADRLGVREGALVESVDKDSPAAKGGVQVKDVITRVDDQPVHNALSLRRAVEKIAPGTNVKLAVVRDGKTRTLAVKLGEAPDMASATTTEPDSGGKTGISVQPLTQDLARQLNIDADVKGVVVKTVTPGSSADRAGIRARDVIVEIDNTPVTSVASFASAVKNLKKGDTAIVVVQRADRTSIIEMPID